MDQGFTFGEGYMTMNVLSMANDLTKTLFVITKTWLESEVFINFFQSILYRLKEFVHWEKYLSVEMPEKFDIKVISYKLYCTQILHLF